jgi:hypothetical protein
VGCAAASVVGGLIVPNLVMRDQNGRYEYTAARMGPYDSA